MTNSLCVYTWTPLENCQTPYVCTPGLHWKIASIRGCSVVDKCLNKISAFVVHHRSFEVCTILPSRYLHSLDSKPKIREFGYIWWWSGEHIERCDGTDDAIVSPCSPVIAWKSFLYLSCHQKSNMSLLSTMTSSSTLRGKFNFLNRGLIH
jgi:hypothetical protein